MQNGWLFHPDIQDMDGFSIQTVNKWMDFPSRQIFFIKCTNSEKGTIFNITANNIMSMLNRRNQTSVRNVKIDWSIKGYHVFNVRPHPEIELIIEPEPTNRYDPFAMKVMLPPLAGTPAYLQSEPSVVRNAGCQVGRVPANLCRAFRTLMDRRLVQKLFCSSTGIVSQSNRPHVHQRYHRARSRNTFDIPGGGAELKCWYHLEIEPINFEESMHILEDNVPLSDLDEKLYA